MSMVDDIPQSITDEIDAEAVRSAPTGLKDHASHVQTQFNVHVWGQLHGMVDNNYHRVYDLGSNPDTLPQNLEDIRILYSGDFQSVTHGYLESSITKTELLK